MLLRDLSRLKVPALALGAGLLVCIAAACSGAPSQDAPDFEVEEPTKEPERDAKAPPTPTDAGAGDSQQAGPATTYRGTLAATESVAFGGGTFCNYEIKFEDVAVEVTLQDGNVTAAKVKNRAVEKAIECQYTPSPPSVLDFTLKTATTTTTGMRLAFDGAEANSTDTELLVDLVVKGDGYDAALSWKRLDQKAPLDWLVTTKVLLRPM